MELVPERTLRLKSLEVVKKKESWFFILITAVLIANILVLITLFRRYDFFYWLKSSPSEIEHVHLIDEKRSATVSGEASAGRLPLWE
ncbi:MAG TPA: hypothetical protein VNM72_11375 [Blastocatellia bacterium]|nr:hypothetical protein [Blastocatellia bacterium]